MKATNLFKEVVVRVCGLDWLAMGDAEPWRANRVEKCGALTRLVLLGAVPAIRAEPLFGQADCLHEVRQTLVLQRG